MFGLKCRQSLSQVCIIYIYMLYIPLSEMGVYEGLRPSNVDKTYMSLNTIEMVNINVWC